MTHTAECNVMERGGRVIIERRGARRHDLEPQQISVERWDGPRRTGMGFGQIIDLSSGGVRIRTSMSNIRTEQQVRLRLALPTYAGISPFVDVGNGSPQPKTEWIGWMAVTRVRQLGNGEYDVAGRLVGMEDLDRGMLSLYLSTWPLAA